MTTSLKVLAAGPNNPGIKRVDSFRVDPRLMVEEPGFNARDYKDPEVKAHIRRFADSYKAGHYVPPVIVRLSEGQIIVIEGHCRRLGALTAIEEGADLPFLDAIQSHANDLERIDIMLRSADGLKLKPLNVAMNYKKMLTMGRTVAEIASSCCRSVGHVDQMLILANANSDVHKLVKKGAVAAHVAVEAVRKHGEKAGAYLQKLLDKAEAKGKTKVTAAAVKEPLPPRKILVDTVAVVTEFRQSLGNDTLAALARWQLDGNTEGDTQLVQVSAHMLEKLLAVADVVADSLRGKADKEKAATQMSIPEAQAALAEVLDEEISQ